VLFQYVSDPHILPYVQAIIGEDVKSVHTMLINKPPDVGLGSSRHPLHQDLWVRAPPLPHRSRIARSPSRMAHGSWLMARG
jgi:hypothetical protein